ncbi:tRNA uridine-5-carboxymethylaminomethyl(34) synthesis GTPase MnmE [Allosphingosinicella flava]|uniref:tRNA modification GTPase MnmE n=1 Tax=Allosphingosinicella flava TaxID=2771430 RepID=A0A7T2LLH8_9SPHN|nr:tRNA uridine-5-carboxymethylaminomethyl(34) synthesis GTPase MnmE [Sphingosinicella flava]QPQ54535.1 tRNA uridine-5-carboxymethylaminomethyl(34) synthesis GTPase MnmE [Sphingosinicella flava]
MNARPDTIYALSSGTPPAAIGIIRVSGPLAAGALAALAGRVPQPRRASYARLRHPKSGDLLDHALILFFPGPRTATGEDLCELHVHGGRSVVAAVLEALSTVPGLRAAEAGEFTRRAFENGRIDLTEAEGIADLLTAETESQRRSALAMAGGALSREIRGWQEQLLAIAAQVEAEIDFSDEGDVGAESAERWRPALAELERDVARALKRPSAERLRDGIRVVIAGPPNAGKSTLMNALAGRDVAITSPLAGTTRDSIEAPVSLGGYPFILIDTAGLRESQDMIEAIGVERAEAHLEAADVILWLGKPDDRPSGPRIIRISAKSDIAPFEPGADLAVSALGGEGLDRLLALLIEISAGMLPAEGEVAINRRHREAFSHAAESLKNAAHESDLLLVAEELRQVRLHFDRVTGQSGVEDMLDALFGRFCIGK